MTNKISDIKKDLKRLNRQGHLLLIALDYSVKNESGKKEWEKELKKWKPPMEAKDLPIFNMDYEKWYSESLIAIKFFLPDRLDDFIKLYRNDKRKKLDVETYTISDAIIGLRTTRGSDIIADMSTAMPKLQQQISILAGVENVVESVINSFQFDIRADLFDSELDAGKGLLKAGFYRAAGAMCGVVLEKHFSQVCIKHEITITKKNPTIYDYNEALKNANVIDLPTFRYIQLLGDLRNICCHDKSIEPTKEQTNDLLSGTSKIIKTVF